MINILKIKKNHPLLGWYGSPSIVNIQKITVQYPNKNYQNYDIKRICIECSITLINNIVYDIKRV